MNVANAFHGELKRRASKLPLIPRIFSNFAREYLPSRVKRIIFVSSVLGVIRNNSNIEDEVLAIINEKLTLANDAQSMHCIIKLHKFIWKKPIDKNSYGILDIIEQYNNGNNEMLEELLLFFYMQMPDWMLYASKNLINHDLTIALNEIKKQS